MELHFITLSTFGNSIDYGAVFTGYLGLILVGSVYASIGVFSSAVTDNQVISFIVGIAIIFVFWLFVDLTLATFTFSNLTLASGNYCSG